ncbi:S41 family peptidase [Fulvivirgaceae bacterium PWU4]|uniref:S41 family peptidase n=1 Tax=Chryseosolibacter histidini TaxID=2782349 RepID=A0AAP2DIU9_9BACT|nr:S41 family peptidase [Chryseosolibacter histidini]MBT1695787.1 S41 family peptidase [Chryseosolibacter histidini]
MKKRILYPIALVVVLVGLAFTGPAERYFEIAKNLDIFATLFKEVNALYVDEVNPNTLVRTGIDAMLASLDPYTNYIPEDEVEDFRTINTGQYGGIGAVTREIGNRTVVTMIMEGYGAQKGGLKIGDEVLKIDDLELSKLSREQSSQLMKGQVGTPVSLTVRRIGVEQPIKLDFKREKIKVNNVPYFGMVGKDIAYIHLSDFTPDAGKEVRNALVALKEQGAQGVILDLRGNPGGLLIEAVNITNLFLPKGKMVVSTKGKIPENNLNYETLNNPTDTEIPVAVLINRGSASASEIVAGTLQDYDRGVVLGEKSYGKGLVQVSRPLSYNSQLKVTTAKYYTPTGRCIQVLDYGHRRDDGSVGSIPDSLKKAFKTTNGRTVYDGGGIEPDVKIQPVEAHPLTQVLFEKGFIFDFATQYVYKHQQPADARNFNLSDEDYQQFITWMKDKNYSYKSYLEFGLQQFSEEAKKEKYYSDLKNQIEQIQARIAESKKNELVMYKDQIKMLLEEEIVSRYFLEKGGIETGFKHDQEVKKAIDVLHNAPQYKKILNIQ